MANDDQKALDAPVAASPPKLKEAFHAAMLFPNRLSALRMQREVIKSAAEAESLDGVLRAGEEGLTPGMRITCIQPAAGLLSDWTEARGKFETELQPFIPKIAALDHLNDNIRDLQRRYDQSESRIDKEYRDGNEKYADVEKEYHNAEGSFERIRLQERSRPVKIPPWYYWILMATLGSVEALINYEAFYRSFGEILGLAVGSTFIVAIVIAVISHVHGTVLKQWRSWFGPDIEYSDRYWRAGLLALATLALVCVLIFVGWSRYDMAMQLMGQSLGKTILGAPRVQQNPVTDVTMTMLMNIAVWIAGIIVAYWLHDENRIYVEAAQHYWKQREAYQKHRRQIGRRIGVAQAQLATELQAARNTAETLSRETREEHDMRDKIRKQDSGVERSIVAAVRENVEAYQHWLCQAGRENGLRIRHGERQYTPEDYQNVRIEVTAEQLQSRIQ